MSERVPEADLRGLLERVRGVVLKRGFDGFYKCSTQEVQVVQEQQGKQQTNE